MSEGFGAWPLWGALFDSRKKMEDSGLWPFGSASDKAAGESSAFTGVGTIPSFAGRLLSSFPMDLLLSVIQ
jgi:hypothetical protein